ncbi:MAG: DegV family protein [Mycoplasma sp.]
MKKIRIIIDTMTTVTDDFIKEHNLHLLRNCLSDHAGNVYVDEKTDEQKRWVANMIETKGEFFATSYINGTIMQEAVEELLKTCDMVLYVSLGKGFSGQYSAALQVEKLFDGKFIVFDSNSVAANNEILLKWLVEYIESGNEIDKKYIEAKMQEINDTAPTLFTTPVYQGLIKAGRVPYLVAKILRISKLFPLIATEESNKKYGFFKKWESNQMKIIEGLDERFGGQKPRGKDIKNIYIVNSLLDQATIDSLIEKLHNYFEVSKDIILVRTTPLMIFSGTLLNSYGVTVQTHTMKKTKL